MGSWFKLPVSVTDVGAVVGFIVAVGVAVAILNKTPAKRLIG